MDLLKEVWNLPVRVIEALWGLAKNGVAPKIELQGRAFERRIGIRVEAWLMDKPEESKPPA